MTYAILTTEQALRRRDQKPYSYHWISMKATIKQLMELFGSTPYIYFRIPSDTDRYSIEIIQGYDSDEEFQTYRRLSTNYLINQLISMIVETGDRCSHHTTFSFDLRNANTSEPCIY